MKTTGIQMGEGDELRLKILQPEFTQEIAIHVGSNFITINSKPHLTKFESIKTCPEKGYDCILLIT